MRIACMQAKAELEEGGGLFWNPGHRCCYFSCLMWSWKPNLGLPQEQEKLDYPLLHLSGPYHFKVEEIKNMCLCIPTLASAVGLDIKALDRYIPTT